MYAFVLAKDGSRLMPTNIRKARKLLDKGKVVIYKHHPFTIQLTGESRHCTQSIEFCEDTGSEHVGVSIKSETHEYVHAQYDHLSDEKQRHEAQALYRRSRRGRKRYRKPRFDNRRRNDKWLAPTVEHKKDNHIRIFDMYAEVCPITRAVFEVGQFDPAAMQALEETGEVLQGTDYQHGKKFQLANLREAVFTRDRYTCQVCGKSVKDGVILHAHHIIYRSNGGTDRINNLMTVCDKCHTPKNHKPGGKLYGLKPLTGTYRDVTFMNIVRWYIKNDIQNRYPDITVEHTYGSYTKASRRDLGQLPKTHANDAYAMGEFHPKHRCRETHYIKRRRNNRCLEKFYDAKYTDMRDGTVKKGSEIGCNRTKRNIPRNNPNNERMYRGHKVSKGRVSVRRQRYSIQPGDTVRYRGSIAHAKGVHCNGTRVMLDTGKSVKITDVAVIKRTGGWQFLPA